MRLSALTVALGLVVDPLSAFETEGLCIAPSAVDIVHRKGKGTASIEYYVKESFPATDTLAFIQKTLAEGGWRPVRGADLGGYESSSLEDGWIELPSEDKPRSIRLWSARWRDRRGNEVVYTLDYASPLMQHGLEPSHVSVTAWYYTKKRAAEARADLKRTIDRFARPLRRNPPAP